MALSYGKVGVAPGTTTLKIGPGGAVTLADHAQAGSSLGYFDARPTDFDISRSYGYTPRRRGWIYGWPSVAPDSAPCCASCGAGGPCASGLGQDAAPAIDVPDLTTQQQAAISQFVMQQLALEEKTLEIKERKSRRFWGAIAGMAAGTTALVALLTYMKK